MATIAEISAGIVERLDLIDGLRSFDHPPQGIAPPMAFCVLDAWEPNAMGRKGQKAYEFDLYVFTSESARPADGYRSLMRYADASGSQSIDLVIWDGNNPSAGTFNGLADTNVFVSGFNVLGSQDVDAFQMYGGVFRLQAHTKG